jgi:hypothetical protein
MVTENVEQLPLESPGDPTGGGELGDVNPQQEDAPELLQQPGDTEAPAEQPPATGVPTPSPSPQPPADTTPASPQYTPEQIAKMQQSSAQYEQVQMRAALQTQADSYKAQLEQQGYLPEHAEQAANAYMQSQQQQMSIMSQAEEYGQHLQGKQMAVEFFVKKYKLNIDDMSMLRVYEDPKSMDQAAQKMAHDRERDNELAQFKQARVPAQSFDNSQGSPGVAADEGGWLDRYNSGDRSSSAVAAARRAAGLQ